MPKPLVSIIAICHKHAPYLIKSLDSFKNQTHGNIQLIIINNVKDECEEIIQTWIEENEFENEPIFIQNDKVKNVVENCNMGLSFCDGKYFQPISCDDLMASKKIENQVALFESLDDSYACVFGGVEKIDEDGKVIDSYLNKTSKEIFKERTGVDLSTETDSKLIVSRGALPHAAAYLLKTRVVNALGGYDERYLWEDYQMVVRLVYNNYKIKYIDEVLNYCLVLNNSLSKAVTDRDYYFKINWMYFDLYFKYNSIFQSDYKTRIRFTRRFNFILKYDIKEFLKISRQFIKLQKFPSNIIAFFNIYFIYPIARVFKIDKYVFKTQDYLYRILK